MHVWHSLILFPKALWTVEYLKQWLTRTLIQSQCVSVHKSTLYITSSVLQVNILNIYWSSLLFRKLIDHSQYQKYVEKANTCTLLYYTERMYNNKKLSYLWNSKWSLKYYLFKVTLFFNQILKRKDAWRFSLFW